MPIRPGLSRGQLLRYRREQLGLSREHFARKADVSTSMVERLERTDRLPKAEALGRIAAVAGLTVEDLLHDQQTVGAA